MKKLLAVLLAAIACVACMALVGCGGAEGTYKFESMTMTYGDETVTIKAGDEFQGMTFEKDMMIIELKKGGKCIMTSSMYGEAETEEGTWKKDGDTITITSNNMTQNIQLKDGKLIINMEGTEVVLSK